MKKKLLSAILCCIFSISAAFADGPFRNHRYDAFKVLPISSEQIVFIGNSITNMHEWWEAFGNHNVVNRGVSGAVTDEALANIEAIAAGKPKKVFIMLGTNDLGTNGINTTEHVLTNMNLIVERFKQTSPDTEIYIQSILPSTSGIRTLDALRAANTALQAMCTEKGATYIDLWDDMMGITSNALSYDYLHLTSDGYKIWCDKIAQYVNDNPEAKSLYGAEAQNNGGLGGANGMRATVFSKLPVNSDDILIIGDEMVNGGEWHELLKSSRVKNRGTSWGYPGPSLSEMLKMVNAIFNGGGKPAQVFLYAGVGDVNGSTALETVLANYKSVVARIKELSPATKITLMSLQPTSTAATNTGRVAPFNELLAAYAAESNDDNIEYLDIYTDFVNNNVANTAYFNGNYLYGKGYVKVAQKIAAAINEQGITAIADDEADAAYTRFANRTVLGNAIVTAAALPEGNGVGEYTSENLTGVKNEIAAAYRALAEMTEANATFNATPLTTATNELLPKINMPATSNSGTPQWFQLYTPNRDSRYLASNGAGAAVVGMAANNYERSMWKFVTRSDGKLDIINRKDGSYLSPTAAYNNPITTSGEQPSNGWELSYANSPGLFIVHSGTVQLNQTQSTLGYKVYNWSAGQSGTDRSDTGCQYKILLCTSEPEIEPVVPTDENFNNVITNINDLTEGWYKMRVVTGTDDTMTGYINAGNNNILNANTAYRQSASNFYPLKIGAYNTSKPATGWFYIKKIGSKYLIQVNSGLGIQEPCTATRDLTQGLTTISMNEYGYSTVDKWHYYNPGANTEQPYVGKSSSSNNKFAFAPVSANELAAYDIYTVTIAGVENASEIGNDPSVTYNGTAAIGGISKVFNNGYFFFPAGTVPVANDFTIPEGLMMTVDISGKRLVVAEPSNLSPIVTIDALTFESYPYEVSKDKTRKLIAATDVTIAMEVTMPSSFNGRHAFISAGDPTLPTATSAVKDNSPYFAYGHYGANVAYLASSLAGDRFTTSAATLTANAVSKVVVVLDKTNGKYKVYVDGTLHQEQSFPAAGYQMQTFSKLAGNDNARIYIGGGRTQNGDIETFQGKIHTVQFFDRALTVEEITTIEYPASKYFFAANTKQSDGSYIDRYIYVNGASLATSTGYELNNPNYEWSLILNGNDAYYLKNGCGKYLSYSPTSLKVADEAYSFQLKNEAVHAGVGALALYNPTSSGGKYMVMSASGNGFNQNSLIVNNGSWCSDFILTSVAASATGYPAITTAINEVSNFLLNTTEGTDPGCYTAESRAALQKAVVAAETLNNTDGLTEAEVASAVATLTAALTTYKAARCDVQYSTDETPVWYYITSASTKGYCTGKAIVSVSSEDGAAMKFDTKRVDPNMVWCLEKNAAGKVAIRNYATGRYFAANPANGTSATAQNVYTVAKWEGASLDNLGYTIKADGLNPVHAQQSGSVIVNWAAEDNGASLWKFVGLTEEELASAATVSSSTVQLGVSAVGIGGKKYPLLRTNFTVSGLNGTAEFNALEGRLNYDKVEKLYLYSVADAYEYRSDREDAVLLGETVPVDGVFAFELEEAIVLPTGTSDYYWLVADIADNAAEGDVIDAEITEFVIGGESVAPANGNPANSATVFLTASTVEYLNTHESRYYRIPAITTAMNGWLVAVTDKRWGSNGDLPNNIDVVARVSKDNGKTWTEPVTIAGTAELGGDYGHGDPAIVTDRVTGDIFVLVTSKEGFFYGTPESPARLKYIVSHDNGMTWDAPVDITDMIYGAGCEDETRKTWHSMFFSSGAALQTSKGTLMCVAPVRTTSNTTHSLFQAHIIRSEDHGKTWTCNGVYALTDADESKIVELNDGTLLVKSRNQNKGNVYYATSTDDGKTWNERKQFDIKDSACNGDVIRLTSEGVEGDKNRLLLSIPFANDRRNVSVFLSTDEAQTWPVRKTICPGGSAYSTMCVLEDGTIGIYYEEDGLEGGYHMRYVRFSLDWLTDGTDKIDAAKFNAARVKEAQALAANLPEHAQSLVHTEGKKELGYLYTEYTYDVTEEESAALEAAETSADLQAIQDALTGYMDGYSRISVFMLPEAGKYYRIKAVAEWNDDAPYLGAKNSTAKAGRAQFVTGTDANSIFYFDGDELLSYASGHYLVSNSDFLGYNGVQTAGSKIAFHAASNNLEGAFNISFNNGNRWLYCHNNDYTDAGGRGDQNGYCFNVEEVTSLPVTVTEAGYATLYAPVALEVADGVKAYTVAINGDWAKLNEIEGGVISANTGVVLEGEGSYEFVIAEDVEAIESDLRGSIATTYYTEPGTYYALGWVDKEVGFYRDALNNNRFQNNSHKAYLYVSNPQGIAFYGFRGEDTTGIENVDTENSVKAIYDLAGRCVETITAPGAYIVNGKKVLIK